jgi:hypothetical protein
MGAGAARSAWIGTAHRQGTRPAALRHRARMESKPARESVARRSIPRIRRCLPTNRFGTRLGSRGVGARYGSPRAGREDPFSATPATAQHHKVPMSPRLAKPKTAAHHQAGPHLNPKHHQTPYQHAHLHPSAHGPPPTGPATRTLSTESVHPGRPRSSQEIPPLFHRRRHEPAAEAPYCQSRRKHRPYQPIRPRPATH